MEGYELDIDGDVVFSKPTCVTKISKSYTTVRCSVTCKETSVLTWAAFVVYGPNYCRHIAAEKDDRNEVDLEGLVKKRDKVLADIRNKN